MVFLSFSEGATKYMYVPHILNASYVPFSDSQKRTIAKNLEKCMKIKMFALREGLSDELEVIS